MGITTDCVLLRIWLVFGWRFVSTIISPTNETTAGMKYQLHDSLSICIIATFWVGGLGRMISSWVVSPSTTLDEDSRLLAGTSPYSTILKSSPLLPRRDGEGPFSRSQIIAEANDTKNLTISAMSSTERHTSGDLVRAVLPPRESPKRRLEMRSHVKSVIF